MAGVLAAVLRPREAECPLVRSLGREFLTCLVMQPIMNFASPGYINELIEFIFLAANDDTSREVSLGKSNVVNGQCHDHSVAAGINQSVEPHANKILVPSSQLSNISVAKVSDHGGTFSATSEHGHMHTHQTDSLHHLQPRSADWARVLDAAQQRRTQVLAPENLENLWTKGRNYNRKKDNLTKASASSGLVKKTSVAIDSGSHIRDRGNEKLTNTHGSALGTDDKSTMRIMQGSSNAHENGGMHVKTQLSQSLNKGPPSVGTHLADEWDHTAQSVKGNKTLLKRSSSTSALKNHPDIIKTFTGETGEAVRYKEFQNMYGGKEEASATSSSSALVLDSDGSFNAPKLKCRVTGAYFEKMGSKSFAVYSIAVKDAENRAWVVKRRYRNFERLHRHLKDIPNYTLHLPPKRFLSSSIDDSFVLQRCILLDKYLQDLLSIANVAEQHEVWDFLSVSSKNYAFGKSPSVMRTLAVNVDDAMDDIVRQFKGVSDGLLRKVSGPSSLPHAASSLIAERHMTLSWNEEETSRPSPSYSNVETSDNEEEGIKHGTQEEVESTALINGWHSDNELNSKCFPPRVIKRSDESRGMVSERSQQSEMKFERLGLDGYLATNSLAMSDPASDPVRVPPEWTPPNLSVPLLNLVDKIFQLNRRGWLRRQVFWISKQILQLMMEDAIDDWLLWQINWLQRDDIIAQGIHWVQDVLWPNGTFFLNLENGRDKVDGEEFNQKPIQNAGRLGGHNVPRPGSFELQLEAARRASDVKKMLLGGAPTALVSLIGHKQYSRCAKDIYYFLQSTVCLKQLAYCMLELLLVSVFPELRDVIRDIHEKANFQAAQGSKLF
eukprot:TRINITY_DN3993_c0_g1_i1.p1 TRINITY_DN3993_c0_g1~~TRINITY_DN3993_c0_g1_i1.p1  ORF type:complete len:836 (+),score=169.80 TRINITY_DN3993_c0_g1_i1:982-3489(+)